MIDLKNYDYVVIHEDGGVSFWETYADAFNFCNGFPYAVMRIYTLTDVLERVDNNEYV